MNETQDKLSWLAFRYVANELDVTETSEFEALLATDQLAREAVAKAVDQTARIRQALASDAAVMAASQRSGWNQKTKRIAVAVFGSLLTLLLALGIVRLSQPISVDVRHQTVQDESSISAAQLAYAWAEARHGLNASPQAADVEFANTLDYVLNEPIDSESEQSLAAPSWMLAALAKMDGGIESGLDIQE